MDKLGGANVEKSRLELQLAMQTAARSKDTRDLSRIRSERDAAVSEYQMIMSERDSVLRELEQLRSNVTELETKIACLEEERKAALDEVERERVAAEMIRREADSMQLMSASSVTMDSGREKEIERLEKELEKRCSEVMGLLYSSLFREMI